MVPRYRNDSKKVGQNDVQLICEKQKDYPEFDPMQFVFVTLGGDDDTPVLEMVPTSTRPNTPRLGKNEQLAMDTNYEATKSMPASCRLHLEDWRSAFLKRHTGDTDKAKNDAFSRARRDLVSKGFLTVDNDFYSLGDKAKNGDIRQNVAGQNLGNGDATDTPLYGCRRVATPDVWTELICLRIPFKIFSLPYKF